MGQSSPGFTPDAEIDIHHFHCGYLYLNKKLLHETSKQLESNLDRRPPTVHWIFNRQSYAEHILSTKPRATRKLQRVFVDDLR